MTTTDIKPLKILYLAQANYTGTLDLFVNEHRRRGNIADFVTLTKSTEGFDDGLCINLRPNGQDHILQTIRDMISENSNYKGERSILPGTPPFYKPSMLHKAALRLQDAIYSRHIYNFINRYKLLDYDIYHLESGMDFFKDYRILPKLKEAGKILIANYHGNDFRNRGVHPTVHALADANTSCEWDVHLRYPGSYYQYLPKTFTNQFPIKMPGENEPVRMCHMVRTKGHFYYKGTKAIINAAEKAAAEHNAEFRLLVGLPHDKALAELAKCHLLIDQIGGKAGFGYGMTAVEALSMGLAVAVEIQPEIRPTLSPHPFIEVTEKNIYNSLTDYLTNRNILQEKANSGYKWVRNKHSVESIVDELYLIYNKLLHK